MKTLFIISFVFFSLSTYGQILLTDSDGIAMLNDVSTPMVKASYSKFDPYTTQESSKEYVPGTFKASYLNAQSLHTMTELPENKTNVSDEPVATHRTTIPGEFEPILGPNAIEGFSNVYSTSCTMGKFTFSCDYYYSDDGTLTIAEPCWEWGK